MLNNNLQVQFWIEDRKRQIISDELVKIERKSMKERPRGEGEKYKKDTIDSVTIYREKGKREREKERQIKTD